MGWDLLFNIDGSVIVRCTSTDNIINSYPSLDIFQCFAGYMKQEKKKEDPRDYNGDDYYNWYDTYIDEENNKPRKIAYKYQDKNLGKNSFDFLNTNQKEFLKKEYGYY